MTVRPDHASIKPGEQVAFACSAHDQYEQPYPLTVVEWSATGGTITKDGVYTAGGHGGLYTVKAEAGGREVIAEVRVATEGSNDDEEEVEDEQEVKPGTRIIRWRGTVPPQKWMNFSTKVLIRFASSPDLKLEVSFEIAVDREQAQSKSAENRAGLKDLGLDDNVGS
jgi:hypothetical protein